MTISAKTIADSLNPHGSRLFTILCRYPKFIHAEHCRHRSFSFSVSSSRAIPVAKNLEEVRSDELRAAPVWWGKEQKGMESGEELDSVEQRIRPGFYGTDFTYARQQWSSAAMYASHAAMAMVEVGVHKSIINRILEPFLHVNVLCTGTTDGWMNFFGLRLDKAAQPEMRVLAENVWREWNEHEPRKLEEGKWHLPFIEVQDMDAMFYHPRGHISQDEFEGVNGWANKVSAARCARLSYMSFTTQKRSTIEEDLALHNRLVAARHWSPLEHQATPDKWREPSFMNPGQNGNLGPGWRQYRKMMPNEAIALLPSHLRSL